MIRIKRAYEKPESEDIFRILVDRLWPRGLSKDKAKIDLWLKDISPTDALRKWFSHDPSKWKDFETKYRKELKGKEGLLQQIRKLEKEKGVVTLIFSTKDPSLSNAAVLKEILQE